MEIKICSEKNIKDLIHIATSSYQDHYIYLWDDEGANYISANFNASQLQQELVNTNS